MICSRTCVTRALVMALATTMATTFVVVAPAVAKECKADPVIKDGDPFVSRSLGAFPSSLIQWKRAVREEYGSAWDTWRRAEDRRIDCEQVQVAGRGRRWVCTRSARPCSGAPGAEERTKGAFPGRLRRGDSGESVRELQQLLVENGFELPIDGEFGRGTQRAVRRFQRNNDLQVDGIVGRDTWAAL